MDAQNRLSGLIEFVATVQTGSFTAAAASLGLTGSAVGKSVARLEARLGTKLLHRTTRRLTLTNEGEAYFEACRRVIEDLDSVEQGLANGQEEPVGRVRLDLPGAFGRRHVLPVLTDLALRHPRLDFSAMFSERTADIVAEGVDLAVRIGRLEDDSGLIMRRLGTQRLMICASPGYLAAHGTPTSPDELKTRDCIIGWRRSARPSWLLRDGSDRFVPYEVNGRHELSDGDALVAAALNGCGLCQLPTWLIDDELASGALIPVLTDHAGAEMPIHAVWPQTRYMKPKLRVVVDALAQAAEAERSGFR